LRGVKSLWRAEQGLAISKDMFEENREGKEWKNQGERESRPVLQKAFF